MLPVGLDRDLVIAHLKAKGAIGFWFYSFPFSFFARSPLSSKQLQDIIMAQFKPEYILVMRFVANSDYSGLVPDNHAQYFINP